MPRGGLRAGAGRPEGTTIAPEKKKSVQVQIRITEKERAILEEQARAQGIKIAQLIRQKIFG